MSSSNGNAQYRRKECCEKPFAGSSSRGSIGVIVMTTERIVEEQTRSSYFPWMKEMK